MGVKQFLQKLATSQGELDEKSLRQFCQLHEDAIPIEDLQPRQLTTVVGEIASTRIVPHPDGVTWLEAMITDGTGSLTVMWTGRRRIAGVKPGQRLTVTGRPAVVLASSPLRMVNPSYELL